MKILIILLVAAVDCTSGGTSSSAIANTCPDCLSGGTWSNAMDNTHVIGGTANSAISISACQSACSSTLNCYGIDWDFGYWTGQQCFLIHSTSSGLSYKAGVAHYTYTANNCRDCIADGTWSNAIDNTQVIGGTANSAISISACQSACLSTINCNGIDWNTGLPSGQQCFLILTTSSGLTYRAGVTHYEYTANNCRDYVASGIWSNAIDNTQVIGGIANSAISISACQSACSSTVNCYGIDWDFGYWTGDQCFLILTTSSGPSYKAGVTHYNYRKINCPDWLN